MGVDFLDLAFELEEKFGVRVEVADMLPAWTSHGNDCTAGELHEIVCRKCEASGVKVPRSSWNRTKIALVNSLGVRPKAIHKDAWLRRDLKFY